jgi:hypothetical protein
MRWPIVLWARIASFTAALVPSDSVGWQWLC